VPRKVSAIGLVLSGTSISKPNSGPPDRKQKQRCVLCTKALDHEAVERLEFRPLATRGRRASFQKDLRSMTADFQSAEPLPPNRSTNPG
jgi:hypothetical protein